MAPNATATRSAKSAAAKKLSRQPPENSVWVRYHPWMEGAISNVASWAIHALVIGGALLWAFYLAYWFGFARPPHSLPVEPVQFIDAGGGGNPNGSGAGNGGNHAPDEAVEGDKPNPGNSTTPADQPHLTDVQAQQVKMEFPAEDAKRIISQNTEAAGQFVKMDKDLRNALRDGINPGKGNGGTGKDGGTGTGTGTGTGSGTGAGTGKVLNEREKRMLRWAMKFNTRDGADYMRQLAGLGAIVAIPNGPDQFMVADLTQRPPYHFDQKGLADLSAIQRIWWTDNNPGSVQGLAQAMRYPGGRAPEVIAFIPEKLEQELAQKELAFKGTPEDQIGETTFAVEPSGGSYNVRVVDQTRK